MKGGAESQLARLFGVQRMATTAPGITTDLSATSNSAEIEIGTMLSLGLANYLLYQKRHTMVKTADDSYASGTRSFSLL